MSAEDRVVAALHALADGTPSPPDGENRLAGRLRREHRRRRTTAVLGTLAAVIGIATVAGTVGTEGRSGPSPQPFATAASPSPSPSTPTTEPSPEPSPMAYPPPAADVGGPRWFLAVHPSGTWAFHDARTGRSSAEVAPVGYTVTEVAAGADPRVFYTAANSGTCGVARFSRVEVVGNDIHSTSGHDVPGTERVRGQVLSLALSPDGSRLAYAIATAVNPDYPKECSSYEVRVLDLGTDRTRAWTGGDASVSALNWAPDSRTLLMHVNPCCGDYQPGLSRLDTRARGETFTDLPITPGTDDFGKSCVVSDTASSATEVFAAQECFDAGEVRIVVVDPVTGRVARQVATIRAPGQVRSVSVSPDGRHVLLSGPGENEVGNFRVDDGVVSKLPTHLPDIAW